MTQAEIAEYLDLSQQQLSEWLRAREIDWRVASLDEVRVAYIRWLRQQAAGHVSQDNTSLIHERVLSERVERAAREMDVELKRLQVGEKRETLVNVAQLTPALEQMMAAFRTQLMARDQALADELANLHGIQVDVTSLNERTYAALAELAGYDPGSAPVDPETVPDSGAPGEDLDDGLGAGAPAVIA